MTSLNIVAHPDDDLLFMNPDIAEELERGEKVYVVYLTAGDDGNGRKYIDNRMKAAEETYLRCSRPHAHRPKLYPMEIYSSSFRNGNPYGDLYRMWHEPEYVPHDARGHEVGANAVLYHLTEIYIKLFHPDLIRIHNPQAEPALTHDEPALDHVDHIYAGKFALEAAKAFPHIPVYAYMGYPVRYQPPNLTPHQVELKTKMWRAYQSVDTSVAGEQWDVALSRCYKERVQ